MCQTTARTSDAHTNAPSLRTVMEISFENDKPETHSVLGRPERRMGEPTYRPLLRVADVGKVQRDEDSGFTLEAGEPISIAGKRLRQDPERHLGVQLGIGGLVDLSHTPSPMRAVTR